MCGRVRIAMLVKMDEKSGGENVTSAGGINLKSGIGREARTFAVLEECRACSSIGCEQEWDACTPIGQQRIGQIAPIVRERQKIVVAEDQNIEQRKERLCLFPARWPDASIIVPAPQPALGSRCQ